MELSFAVVAILVVLAVYICQRLVKFIKFIRKAAKLPTKRPSLIFGHIFEFSGPRSSRMKKTLDIIQQNEAPFTMWIGPIPQLALTKPEHIEVILGSSKLLYKDFPYTFMKSWLGEGLVTANGLKWQTHRKLLTPSFHFSILEKFIDAFVDKSKILVKTLQKEIGSEKFDVCPYIKRCTLEIILETAMGVEIDDADSKEHAEYVDACCNMSTAIMDRTLAPWLFSEILYSLTPGGRRYNKYLKIVHTFTDKVIQERKQQFQQGGTTVIPNDSDIGKKQRLSFLDLLLETSQSGKLLTDQDIRDEVQTFMFAGHDTTAGGICWCLQMLASHPEVQERTYEEMKNIFHDSNHSPTLRDLNEMKYLERVIKETLRLYPSAHTIGRLLQEDVNIAGYTIPAGMSLGIVIIGTHRDPELYPDPTNFNPDNFLPERVAKRHPYAYIPFSAGPRNCIGQKFALLEMKTLLCYIIRHYKLEATGEIPSPLPDLILKPENGIQIKITPRVASV